MSTRNTIFRNLTKSQNQTGYALHKVSTETENLFSKTRSMHKTDQ